MDQGDPLEKYGNIRRDLEEEILRGTSPKPDRRHAQIRFGLIEKYKHIPLERMIKENAKDPTWGTQLISAFESLYGLGGELLRLSAKGEEQTNTVVSIDKELQEISGATDILRSLGYRYTDDTSAIAPAGAQINRNYTSAVLAELLLAKNEMMAFLSGKHVLHDEICQVIPVEYCPMKRRLGNESTKENTQTGKDEISSSEATNEDKTGFPETVSIPPTGLTGEESRCPQCDFINLADANICISCAEPFTNASQGTYHAEPLKKTSQLHTEPLTETSRSYAKPPRENSPPKAEQLTDTSLSHDKQLADTVLLFHTKQLTDTSTDISRAESLTDNRLSHAKSLTNTSQKRAEPPRDSSVQRAEPPTYTSRRGAETLSDTRIKDAKPLTCTSPKLAELLPDKSTDSANLQTDTSGLKDTEPEGQHTLDEISCPHCTFDNPKTNKICGMCSKTMDLPPLQLQSDNYPGSEGHEKPQFLQLVQLPDISATSQTEQNPSKQNGESGNVINIPGDSSASLIGHKQPHDEEESTRVNEPIKGEEEKIPGCPRCTFQNPLPTNYCTMCGERLTKAVNYIDSSPQRLTDPPGYKTKHGVQATSDRTEGQDVYLQCDQSLVKNKEEYSKTEVSSAEQFLLDEGSKEFIRCITCKGALEDDIVVKERRKCSRCPCSYCRECRQPFTERCYVLACPFTSHCHHKRSCTYWLRQKSKVELEWYLKQSKMPFLSYMDWARYREAEGSEAQWSEYRNYLIKVIQEHRIDPAEGMTLYDLSTIIKTMLDVDVELNANRENMVEFVKKNIPL